MHWFITLISNITSYTFTYPSSGMKLPVYYLSLQGVAALHHNTNFTHLNLSECGEVTDTGVEVSLRTCAATFVYLNWEWLLTISTMYMYVPTYSVYTTGDSLTAHCRPAYTANIHGLYCIAL